MKIIKSFKISNYPAILVVAELLYNNIKICKRLNGILSIFIFAPIILWNCEYIVKEDFRNEQEVILYSPFPNPCYDSVNFKIHIPDSMNYTLDIETIAGDFIASAFQTNDKPGNGDTVVSWQTLRGSDGKPVETIYMAHLYTSTGASKRKYFEVRAK
jgi:hypothetical protein